MSDQLSGTTPRVVPLSVEQYLAVRAAHGSEPVDPRDTALHITRTWAHSPGLMEAQASLQRYLSTTPTIPARIREIAVLRVGWLCSAPYEFGQHRVFGIEAGLTEDEIAALATHACSGEWSALEQAVIDAVEEMHALHTVRDRTWSALTAGLPLAGVIDLVVLVGRYWCVSVVTRALRLELEPGRAGFPDCYEPAGNPIEQQKD